MAVVCAYCLASCQHRFCLLGGTASRELHYWAPKVWQQQKPLNYSALTNPHPCFFTSVAIAAGWVRRTCVCFISPNTAGSNGTQTNTKDDSRGVGRQTMDSEKEACLLTWRQSLFTRKCNTISTSPCKRGICRCCACYGSKEMKNEEECLLLSYTSVSYICYRTRIICNTNSCFLKCGMW